MPMRTIKTIAIIGAGNGGCAAAAHLTQRGFDIRLYGRSAGTIEPLRAIGGVAYEGVLGEGFAPLSLITNDAATAIAGADLVLIMAPTHAHEDIIRPRCCSMSAGWNRRGATITTTTTASRPQSGA
jgi:opine dehydrogenase